jgi:hypothetical protein
MANRDLLKEAIADAKALKETAIANAKAALEEAFEPKLKSMLSAKLQEMEDEDLDEAVTNEAKEEMDEAKSDRKDGGEDEETKRTEKMKYGKDLAEAEEIDEEMDLDELLAELDEAMGEKEDMDEAKDMEDMNEAEDEEEVDVDVDVEDEEVEGEDEDEEIDLEEMSEDDLKAFIEDVIADMVEAGELEAGEEFEAEDEMDSEEEIDIDVEDETEEVMEVEEEVDEVVNEEKEEVDEAKEEMDEMKKEIDELRSELHEVNLLNAKLLYTNKIFRAKNLKEAQKVKVLEAFDKASSVKEVKLVFETLNEGLTTKTVTPIKESLGRASKPAGVAASTPIVDIDPQFARMQKLAGLR